MRLIDETKVQKNLCFDLNELTCVIYLKYTLRNIQYIKSKNKVSLLIKLFRSTILYKII